MEREVTEAVLAPEHAESDSAAPTPGFPPVVEARVVAYLDRLGIRDQDLVRRLSAACLQRASRRAAPGQHEELLRRSLEEAQRRFDAALAQSLNLQGVKHLHDLAAARAALLLGEGAMASDSVLQGQDGEDAKLASLAAIIPQATPPEVPQEMHEQPISFLFRQPPRQ
ncbi:hypothetical protein [Methyloterricola oryzae]|uniref:hypothetical protein n=1 Tax=Methyloterricola oryzae TaxID=1495050 RepID=UPI00069A14AF|nr:hypothetical protein [Methyloterricola oryzae]